ncbi:hypothetical protein [Acidaminococcus timonensis]|uniref:hypothetical protein n=1 Tax=Acidaminococcus timonensis TaxID=1871002 RepID=UPI00294204C4|nr:hypothetical protein [Acidaminococcus timonensis]
MALRSAPWSASGTLPGGDKQAFSPDTSPVIFAAAQSIDLGGWFPDSLAFYCQE